MLRVYQSTNLFELCSCETTVVRSTPMTEAWPETFLEKKQQQSKEMIDYRFKTHWLLASGLSLSFQSDTLRH